MSRTTKPKASSRVGRPPSPFPLRYVLRHDDDQIATWTAAAASSGLLLADWIRFALDGEAKRAVHVAPVTRASARKAARHV